MTARTAKGLCGNLLPCLDHSEVGKPSTEALAKTNMGTITSEEIAEMMRPAPNAAAMLITPKGIFHVRTDSPLWVRRLAWKITQHRPLFLQRGVLLTSPWAATGEHRWDIQFPWMFASGCA